MADELKPPSNPVDEDGLLMKCVDCFWYRGNALGGICFGAPPVAVIVGSTRDLGGNVQPQLRSYWPNVDADRFCGSFKRDLEKELDPLPIAPSPGVAEGTA